MDWAPFEAVKGPTRPPRWIDPIQPNLRWIARMALVACFVLFIPSWMRPSPQPLGSAPLRRHAPGRPPSPSRISHVLVLHPAHTHATNAGIRGPSAGVCSVGGRRLETGGRNVPTDRPASQLPAGEAASCSFARLRSPAYIAAAGSRPAAGSRQQHGGGHCFPECVGWAAVAGGPGAGRAGGGRRPP